MNPNYLNVQLKIDELEQFIKTEEKQKVYLTINYLLQTMRIKSFIIKLTE